MLWQSAFETTFSGEPALEVRLVATGSSARRQPCEWVQLEDDSPNRP